MITLHTHAYPVWSFHESEADFGVTSNCCSDMMSVMFRAEEKGKTIDIKTLYVYGQHECAACGIQSAVICLFSDVKLT